MRRCSPPSSALQMATCHKGTERAFTLFRASSLPVEANRANVCLDSWGRFMAAKHVCQQMRPSDSTSGFRG